MVEHSPYNPRIWGGKPPKKPTTILSQAVFFLVFSLQISMLFQISTSVSVVCAAAVCSSLKLPKQPSSSGAPRLLVRFATQSSIESAFFEGHAHVVLWHWSFVRGQSLDSPVPNSDKFQQLGASQGFDIPHSQHNSVKEPCFIWRCVWLGLFRGSKLSWFGFPMQPVQPDLSQDWAVCRAREQGLRILLFQDLLRNVW